MKSGPRLQNVEVLRGLAALAVTWFHLTNGNPNFLQEGTILKTSGTYGYLGVEVFFVISGFIIPFAMERRGYSFSRDSLDFSVRRLIRLEPAYFVSIAIVVALGFASSVVSPTAKAPADLMRTVTAHVAYLAPWFGLPWLNPVYWTLAIEFQYYLFVIFFVPLLLSSNPWKIRLFLGMVAALSYFSFDDRLLFLYLPLFGMGFIRFVAESRKLGLLEIFAWIIILVTVGLKHLDVPMMAAGLVGLGFLSLKLPSPPRLLLILGGMSYSLYLLHVPIGGRVINLAARLPALWYIQVAGLVCALALSLGAAYMLYVFVERPTAAASHRYPWFKTSKTRKAQPG